MAVDATPASKGFECAPQPFGCGFALNNPVAFPRLAPVVGEAQKVERARFIRPRTVRSDRFGSGKRQQARLLRVEVQSILLEALEDDPVNSLRIASLREANY